MRTRPVIFHLQGHLLTYILRILKTKCFNSCHFNCPQHLVADSLMSVQCWNEAPKPVISYESCLWWILFLIWIEIIQSSQHTEGLCFFCLLVPLQLIHIFLKTLERDLCRCGIDVAGRMEAQQHWRVSLLVSSLCTLSAHQQELDKWMMLYG